MSSIDGIWKPVVGYEGLYEVSSTGKVWSIRRGRVLRPRKKSDGHLKVGLWKAGKGKDKYVHRLVLEAFVAPCPEGMECLHIDGNPENNRVDNLRWGTRGENMLDRVRHGRHHNANKTHCPRGHELTPENIPEYWKGEGSRNCLACSRARGYIQRHPELRSQLQSVADQYYSQIVKEGV